MSQRVNGLQRRPVRLARVGAKFGESHAMRRHHVLGISSARQSGPQVGTQLRPPGRRDLHARSCASRIRFPFRGKLGGGGGRKSSLGGQRASPRGGRGGLAPRFARTGADRRGGPQTALPRNAMNRRLEPELMGPSRASPLSRSRDVRRQFARRAGPACRERHQECALCSIRLSLFEDGQFSPRSGLSPFLDL